MQSLSRRGFLTRTIVGGVLGALVLTGCRPSGPVQRSRPTAAPASADPPVRPAPETETRPPASPTPAPRSAMAPLVAVAPAPSATRAPRQPSVLLVTIDSLRADRIGAYGFPRASTPVLDQLAAEGVRFDYAICQLPQTNASHAALLTGLYPSTNGVKVHMVDHLRPNVESMAQVFAAGGYQTAGIYSWVSLDAQFCGLNRGFQTYDGYVLNRSLLFSDPRLETLSALYRQLKAQVPVVKTADAALGTSERVEETLDGRADVTNAAVFAWLDAHADAGPFFLWVHYFDPHYPYNPPKGYDNLLGSEYRGKVDGSVDTVHKLQNGELTLTPADHARILELYQGEIAYVDSQFGRLLSKLQGRGLLDDTVVVVTGDHGESFGEHGDWTHGLKVFEPEVRVPLLLRYPRRLPAGAAVRAPVQSIDVMPTLLELTGLRPKQSVQGVSLLPLLTGASNGSDRVAFTELADEAFVSMLSFQEWKLIRNNANGELQLYHVSDDAAEQKNLVRDQPRLTRELNARLLDLMRYSGVSR